jgi:hypothetical protein
VRKALWVRDVGGVERSLARGTYDLYATAKDVGGREECEAGMMVFVVVP